MKYFATLTVFVFSMFTAIKASTAVSNLSVYSTGRAQSFGPKNAGQCRQVFSPVEFALTTRQSTRQTRRFQAGLNVFNENTSVPVTDEIVKKTLSNWLQSGHYTVAQINALYALDRSLSPLRSEYISFEYNGEQGGIRIFDGSPLPYRYGKQWHEASWTDSRLPMERRNPDLILPAREKGESVIELGLLDGPKYFVDVVDAAYAYVAGLVDTHYNDSEYSVFQRFTPEIDQLIIYGVTRESLIPLQVEKGFEIVYRESETGLMLPIKTHDGLTLIQIKGRDFINRHYDKSILPTVRGQSQGAMDADVHARFRRGWAQRFDQVTRVNRQVDQIRIEINSLEEANYFFRQAFEEYNETTRLGAQKLDQIFLNYRELVEKLWVVFRSIPLEIKDQYIPNWRNLENLLKDLLIIEDPRLGLDLLDQFVQLAREEQSFDDNSRFSFDQDDPWGL